MDVQGTKVVTYSYVLDGDVSLLQFIFSARECFTRGFLTICIRIFQLGRKECEWIVLPLIEQDESIL